MEPLNESQPMCPYCGESHEDGCDEDDFAISAEDAETEAAEARAEEARSLAGGEHDKDGDLRPVSRDSPR